MKGVAMIEDLLKLSVKIQCADNEGNIKVRGSGTVISDGRKYYVMTAGHCIKNVADNSFYEPQNIKITSYSNSKPRNIPVLNILEGSSFDDEIDRAVLEIQEPGINFDFTNRIKRCDAVFDSEKYFLYGYGGPDDIIKNGRKYELERRGVKDWHLKEDDINNQEIKALDLMGGNSGAGVFFKRLDVYYCIGYAKMLLDEYGTFNDIIVFPTSNFDNILPDSTKESNYFQLVKKWTTLKDEELKLETKKAYSENNIPYMNNLIRKMKVLYPNNSEADSKVEMHLDHYLKGLKLMNEIQKSPYIMKKLNDEVKSSYEECMEDRSDSFNDSHEAIEDLKLAKNCVKEAVQKIFSDMSYRKVVKGYADYDISNRLLICSLDYNNNKEN